ncbi:hypothetical protein LPB140_01190 [Sphingorhabdus lutea]|uniref:DUF11 domain-containing protein n=1 Tax=Sphingorhabdus lutea TaxID=1913578 RepID=A0A1L3J984_9SPHN|nr:SdrD B-like domain-containing protein [Sphingorhabdus lutea]APG61678.1 hypothetical protein LPB140_01190 [Sphingorhabdus lutea]
MRHLAFDNQKTVISSSEQARKLLKRAKWLAGASILAASSTAMAAPSLVVNNVGTPTVVGTGQGKRAIWTNAGTVGSDTIDLVGVITTATLNHTWSTTANRPSITSVGPDDIFIEWRLYRAGTYNITTNSGGVPVVADVHVQFNDVDGPNNERIYLPVCQGDISWVRIDATATTGRAFGAVAGQAETFSLIGDQNYNNQPVSGLEALWKDRSTFTMGRTANSGFLIRFDNPTYSAFDTLDFECADFKPPVTVNDSKEGVPGTSTIVDILDNDSSATLNNNPTNNNSLKASEFARASVNLVPPPSATGIITDSFGDVIGFTVPGEGVWSYSDTTGQLTFTPDPSFVGYASTVNYTVDNALGIQSNQATVTVWYPGIGVTKASTFNDLNGDGYGQVGETINYIYQVKSYGAEPLRNPSLTETTFTGAGTPPTPTYVSGDTNNDGYIGLTETWFYSAVYSLVAGDLSGTGVNNSATASGNTAAGTVVNDVSDSANPADGNNNTKSGPGPGNNDATVTAVPRAPIAASNDTQSGTITNDGQANAFNVLSNDSLKGAAPTPSNVAITVTTPASHAGVTLNTSTGQVSVAPGTPAGNYTINYQICEIGNPTNCANAVATVNVSLRPINADDDSGPSVNSTNGSASLYNVLSNDTFNGGAATTPNVTINVTSPATPAFAGASVPSLNISTGVVSVPAGTPAGTYNIGYEICDSAVPTNCEAAIATIIVTPTPIAASNDSGPAVNGAAGNTNAFNAFTNDSFNGNPVNLSLVTATVTSPATPLSAGAPVPSLNTATGVVSVPAGTPAGSYTIGYRICENANPTNCANASITVQVAASPIAANNDSTPAVNSANGGSNLVNALGNDSLNGAAPTASNVNITVTTPASNAGVTMNTATGQVSVAPGTPAGNYSIGYQICEKLNPSNCAIANVTIPVNVTPIAASADTPPAQNGRTGANDIVNAFTNDSLNGSPVNVADIEATITAPATPLTAGAPVPVMDPATGLVDVPAGTPAGTYTIAYEICEKTNPTNCANSSVTVIVSAAPITALNDNAGTVTTANGGANLINALGNDTLNGSPVALADVNLTVTAPASNAGVTLNTATGQVSVAPGTPAGNYSIGYQICEKLNPTNCQSATIAVVVDVTPLNASNDSPAPVNGANGGNDIINAFANDTLNGAPVNVADISATITAPATPLTAGAPVPVMDPATGLVDVPAGTPAGTYTIAYEICENSNPTNCKTATVQVVVTAAPITADADSPAPVNGATGGNDIINAFANDSLNGAPVNVADIEATVTSPAMPLTAGAPVPVMDPATGLVDVPAGTPAGTYTIAYEICEKLNPNNCASSTVNVVVTAAPITADADSPAPVNGATGGNDIINAFANDSLNGAPVNVADIEATVTSPATPLTAGAPVPVMDPATGLVDVPVGTPAGTYTIAYEICEKLNPNNCATNNVTVVVTAAPIAASNDAVGPVPGISGGSNLINALNNDMLNGASVAIADINVTVTSPASHAGVTLDPATGMVSVAPNTPAGTYTIGYQICEKLNPTNCANAIISVTVDAAPIMADVDSPAPVNGANGGNDIINAFANDSLNGAPVNVADIDATITTPATPATPGAPVPVMDPATGLVDVSVGTPAGTYTIAYEICQKLNPTNCASSNVTIVVEAPEILAANDVPAPVRSGVGNPNAINAFANDILNGSPVDVNDINVTILTPAAHAGVVLDPATGIVSVTANVPDGTYIIEYQICEKLNPTNCKTATVTVVVEPPVSSVTGTVFTDVNGDGVLGPDEPRRAGWIVEIMKDGVVVATTTTDANGDYRVDGLLSGPGYDIVFRNPENNVVYDKIEGVNLVNNTVVIDQNQPIDPSGVIYDSITRNPISGVTVRLLGPDGNPLPSICFVDASQASQTTGASGEYRFDIIPGAAPQCPASETVYTIQVTPPVGFADGSTVLVPLPGPFDPSGLPAPVRISPDATPPQGSDTPFYLSFRLQPGDPDVVNNHIALDPFLNRTPLVVTKTSIKRSASTGDLVPYEITVRNTENAQRAGVDVVDILPAGMKYVLGTASVDGVANEPIATNNNRELRWTGQVIPANGSVRYNLTLVVGAGVTGGEKVNTGLAQNAADFSAISNRGTAVVAIVPSAVFDCSELLGKVFEDRNRNGYQDENEPGIAGVRLATVNGQLITTDEFGRYHIACAAVPDARIGSNFVLKVDTRTLPIGWEVTFDNPKSIRLTRGKFGELNFGVAPREEGAPTNSNGKGE